ncbi:MAG TPA: hypothetical protein PLT66_06575 [Bacillota bacterium]|nr:hypothetical protein [Bacillota bacterium]
MDGISSKLSEILSDPQALSQIMELSKRFNAPRQETEASAAESGHEAAAAVSPPSVPPAHDAVRAAAYDTVHGSEKEALLYALRPLLSMRRQEKVDRLIRAAGVAELIGRLKAP